MIALLSAAAEAASIREQSEALTMAVMPFGVIIVGIILGFVMARKKEGEKFRALPLIICVVLAVLGWYGGSARAEAQTRPTVVERFVAAVQAGADFKTGEFASVVISEDAAKLAKLAKCTPGAPRTGDGGSVLILWDCEGVPDGSSAGTGFKVEDDKITFLFVAPMTVVRTR